MLPRKDSFRNLSKNIMVFVLFQIIVISLIGFNSSLTLANPSPDEIIRLDLSFNEETYSQDSNYNHSITGNWESTIWKINCKATQQVFFYFTEQGNNILENCYLSLFHPTDGEFILNNYILANSEREYIVIENRYEIRGYFHANVEGEWGIKINYDENHNIGDYNIVVKLSESGYSFQYPRGVSNKAKIIDGYFSIDTYQYRYWKVSLVEGQRIIIELSGMGLVLGTRLQIFKSPEVIIRDNVIRDFNFTRFDFYPLSTSEHFIRILIPPGSFIGDYIPYTINITKSLEDGYNFDTAIELIDEDQEITMTLEYLDSRFIKFDAPKSTSTRINITESISTVLINSKIEFYNERYELLDSSKGWFNLTYNYFTRQLLIDFKSKISGTYFLKIKHDWNQPDGQITIKFDITFNPPFEINNNQQLIGLVTLTALIILAISFISKKHDDYYWFFSIKSISCKIRRKDIYHSFNNLLTELEKKKTAKIIATQNNQKITFKLQEIPQNITTYFVDSINKETIIHIMEVPSVLTYVITIGSIIIVFSLFSLFTAVLTATTFLPLNLNYITLFSIFLLTSIFTLSCSVYHTIKQKQHGQRAVSWVKNEMEIIESSIFANSSKTKREFLIKSKIHQSRRLWNQATKSFKSTQFNSFVIKADSALFHALEARYYQISGDLNPPSNFLALCNIVRGKNFDIPSQKMCEQFRKTRNGVVHGSINIDSQDANKVHDFASKFFNRLGISNK